MLAAHFLTLLVTVSSPAYSMCALMDEWMDGQLAC